MIISRRCKGEEDLEGFLYAQQLSKEDIVQIVCTGHYGTVSDGYTGYTVFYEV